MPLIFLYFRSSVVFAFALDNNSEYHKMFAVSKGFVAPTKFWEGSELCCT